jgi:hypothetical protein
VANSQALAVNILEAVVSIQEMVANILEEVSIPALVVSILEVEVGSHSLATIQAALTGNGARTSRQPSA